jgi:uncharacterized protein
MEASGIWAAAKEGDLAEVERLVGHDPGLLNARENGDCMTPLMCASGRHVGVVRWLLDQGAAIDERDRRGLTALWVACFRGCLPVARLLLERGADPTIAYQDLGWTPLMIASARGHPEVVRLLLGHPGAKATINQRNHRGETALWVASKVGSGGIVRALLEDGADPTIANHNGITPMAIAKQDPDRNDISAEGRQDCVAALKVSCLSSSLCLTLSTRSLIIWLRHAAWWQEAERAYLLWKARQVADRQGGGAVAVEGGPGGGGGGRAAGLRGASAEGGPVPGVNGVYGVSRLSGVVWLLRG